MHAQPTQKVFCHGSIIFVYIEAEIFAVGTEIPFPSFSCIVFLNTERNATHAGILPLLFMTTTPSTRNTTHELSMQLCKHLRGTSATQECSLCIIFIQLSDSECRDIAWPLNRTPVQRMVEKNQPQFPVLNYMTRLTNFIGARTWLLFHSFFVCVYIYIAPNNDHSEVPCDRICLR